MWQQYDTYYPSLPVNKENQWEKVEYNNKMRLGNPSGKRTEQNKNAKLNYYSLNCPSATNRFNLLSDEDEQMKT